MKKPPIDTTAFNLLSEDEFQMIEKNKIELVFKKGETIRKQGAYLSHVIIINEGLAKLVLEGKNKKNLIIL